MMNKYKYYIIAIVALLIVAILLLLNDKPSTLKEARTHFAVSDTGKIASVQIQANNQTILLERSGFEWRVNKKFIARKKAIRSLMNQLMNIEISAPIDKGQKQSALQSFGKGGVSITIQNENGRVFAYQLAENDSLRIGTLALVKDEDDPYVIALPGYNGPITLLFPTLEEVWRDNTLYHYGPADILSIGVDYPETPSASFQYSFVSTKQLLIKMLHGTKSVNIEREMARNYLMNFASVTWERAMVRSNKAVLDSLRKQTPWCKIHIETAGHWVNQISTYRMPLPTKNNAFDPNQMYAVAQNDTVVMQVKYIDFDPIMKTFDDFTPH